MCAETWLVSLMFFLLAIHAPAPGPARVPLTQLEAPRPAPTFEEVMADLDVRTWRRK